MHTPTVWHACLLLVTFLFHPASFEISWPVIAYGFNFYDEQRPQREQCRTKDSMLCMGCFIEECKLMRSEYLQLIKLVSNLSWGWFSKPCASYLRVGRSKKTSGMENYPISPHCWGTGTYLNKQHWHQSLRQHLQHWKDHWVFSIITSHNLTYPETVFVSLCLSSSLSLSPVLIRSLLLSTCFRFHFNSVFWNTHPATGILGFMLNLTNNVSIV